VIELVCSQDCLTMKSLKITYPDVNISSFSASKSGYVGDSVTLKASVSSGTAPYEYQYSYDDAKGIKHIITAYTAGKTSTTWNTSSLSAGDYTIRVEVRDKNKKNCDKNKHNKPSNKKCQRLNLYYGNKLHAK